MPESFDPYYKWLGIPPKDQPAHHYRLLGIELFESDLQVIESAADRQMSHVRTYQAGKNSAVSQRILNELSAAKIVLLHPKKKETYDATLREQLAIAVPAAVNASVQDVQPAAVPPSGPAVTMPMPPAAFQSSPLESRFPSAETTPVGDFGFANSGDRRRRKKAGPMIPVQVWILLVLIVAVSVTATLVWHQFRDELQGDAAAPSAATGTPDAAAGTTPD